MEEQTAGIMPNALDSNGYQKLMQESCFEGMHRNQMNTNYWTKLKGDYESLISHLDVLPNDLSKIVMVPIGSKALMRGKIVHTNEILVFLGDGWFVKQSAKEAIEICKRRLKMCDERLSDLEKENKLLTSFIEVPFEHEAFGKPDGKEIKETYDEEQEATWREQHRKSEHEYRQKLAKMRENVKPIETEEDMWRKLDELELQEELQDELDRLHPDSSSEDEESSVNSEDDLSSEASSNIQNGDIKDSTEECLLPKQDTVPNTCSENVSSNEGVKSRRVSFKLNIDKNLGECGSSEEGEPLHIAFKHSSCEPKQSQKDHDALFSSPADIYDHYIKEKNRHSVVPKSILKKSPDVDTTLNNNFNSETTSAIHKIEPTTDSREEPTPSPAIQLSVVEHKIAEQHQECTDPGERPMSRFKAARRAQKR